METWIQNQSNKQNRETIIMGDNPWETIHGRQSMGDNPWETIHGRQSMGDNPWETIHRRQSIGDNPICYNGYKKLKNTLCVLLFCLTHDYIKHSGKTD